MGEALEIILADDQGVTLDALAALLTQAGLRVVAMVSTQAGLIAAVGERHPDLCLFSNRFPDGTGVDAIATLAQLSPRTRLVMLTGHRDTETMRQALDAGADGYVHKTRGAQVLLEALRRVASGEVVVEGSFLRTATSTDTRRLNMDRLVEYLTRREYECLAMLAEGLDTDAMAAQLGVSRTTVRTHVQAVLTKLGVHSRLEAASVATRYGLIRNRPEQLGQLATASAHGGAGHRGAAAAPVGRHIVHVPGDLVLDER